MPTNIPVTTRKIINSIYYEHKETLASLRSSNTIDTPIAQRVWPLLLSGLDDDDLSIDGRPTRTETAIYTVLHLYALHQQGVSPLIDASAYGADATGHFIFSMLNQLRQQPDKREALDRRVQSLLATTNFSSVANALAHIIGILKGQTEEPIDYAALALDFYMFQANYESANRVRLRWGETYYRTAPTQQIEGEN